MTTRLNRGGVSMGFGGLNTQWPKFVVNNWNRVAAEGGPYRKYFAWDRLRWQARQDDIERL